MVLHMIYSLFSEVWWLMSISFPKVHCIFSQFPQAVKESKCTCYIGTVSLSLALPTAILCDHNYHCSRPTSMLLLSLRPCHNSLTTHYTVTQTDYTIRLLSAILLVAQPDCWNSYVCCYSHLSDLGMFIKKSSSPFFYVAQHACGYVYIKAVSNFS